MLLTDAEKLARELMTLHNITDWHFKFDGARRRLGLTKFTTKTISLSRALTELNPVEQVRNTILHEIAHVLVGWGNGHNSTWRNKALAIGCNGQRCTDSVVKVEAQHCITCSHCGFTWMVFRKPKNLFYSWHKACGRASIGQLVYK